MSHTVGAFAAIMGLGTLAAACHHAVPPASAARTMAPAATARTRPPAPPPPPPRAVAAPAPLSDEELFRRKSLDQINAEHPLGDVFFDYDQNKLSGDARAVLQKDAAWLAKRPQTRISMEGHCDERGSAQYNLALGDRRAAAARDYLLSLGVATDRVAIRSVGKEAPFCHGEGEACWSQNRRDHFIITAK